MRYFILLFCGIVASCSSSSTLGTDGKYCGSSPPTPSYNKDIHELNACLPKAIVVKKHLNKHGVWCEVLAYYYKDNKSEGHAVAVFEYNDMVWTYDYSGSINISSINKESVYDAYTVAAALEEARGTNKRIYHPEFLINH